MTNVTPIAPVPKKPYLSNPDLFFVPNVQADGDDAYNALDSLLDQAHATISALIADNTGDGFSLNENIIHSVLWAVSTQLNMAKQALEHMSKCE